MLQTIVAAYFRELRHQYKIRSLTECRLCIRPGCYVLPDVMVVEPPHANARAYTGVPAVVVEIKSPEDTFDAIIDKCLEYAELGVPNIVMLDPESRRSYLFHQNALVIATRVLIHLPKAAADLVLPIDQMYAELDAGD